MEKLKDLLSLDQKLNNGRYVIISHIASGGFGNTYKAKDTILDKTCAIKEFFMQNVTHRDVGSNNVSVSNPGNESLFANCKAKFKKEAKRLASLSNPHIVKVSDLFEENNTVYYVMDFIEGCSLSQKMKDQKGPFTEAECLYVLNQLLDALETVHEQDLLHMDIKPANILIDNAGNCTLIDFGASKQIENNGTTTTSTAVAYTPGFAPPEQISGNKDKWGTWTDLFAVGATLYNLISNQPPPLQDDLIDDDGTVFKFKKSPSKQFVGIIKRLMAIKASKRPQNVSEVRFFLKGLPVKKKSVDNIENVVEKDAEATVVGDEKTEVNTQTQQDGRKGKKIGLIMLITSFVLLVFGCLLVLFNTDWRSYGDRVNAYSKFCVFSIVAFIITTLGLIKPKILGLRFRKDVLKYYLTIFVLSLISFFTVIAIMEHRLYEDDVRQYYYETRAIDDILDYYPSDSSDVRNDPAHVALYAYKCLTYKEYEHFYIFLAEFDDEFDDAISFDSNLSIEEIRNEIKRRCDNNEWGKISIDGQEYRNFLESTEYRNVLENRPAIEEGNYEWEWVEFKPTFIKIDGRDLAEDLVFVKNSQGIWKMSYPFDLKQK